MRKKNGFTLIELLAVIIILGILMIIAIPSVTKYISDSRKSSYVNTAKEIVAGARNKVNDGKLNMFDTNSTYYIPSNYVKTENGSKSPYGEFTQAYVGVIYDGKGYKYYWVSTDDAGEGIKKITPIDKLDTDDIVSDLKDSDIQDIVEQKGIGERTEIKILDTSTEQWRNIHLDNTDNNVGEDGGVFVPAHIVCKSATKLHTKTCNRATNGCGATVGYGKTITYGTLLNGSPKAGDAYDCKVTTNGGYTERFYFVKTEGSNTIFISSNNMDGQTTYPYYLMNQNNQGPIDAYQYLPDTSVWNNPGLIAPGSRNIVAENGNRSTSGGAIESFTYEGKAARLLTSQELVNACSSISSIGSYTTGELDDCLWLLENVDYYEKDNGKISYGFWLETPRSDNSNDIWYVNGDYRLVYFGTASTTSGYVVRPVITVKTSDVFSYTEE